MRWLSVVSFACVALGCATTSELDRSEPVGSPSSADLAEVPVRGHRVVVFLYERHEHAGESTVTGELLAVDPYNLWVLLDQESDWLGNQRTLRLDLEAIAKVAVELQPSQSTTAGTLTTVGAISTLSHGFWLVFTAPLWIVTGVPASTYETRVAEGVVAPDGLDTLFQYARWPQGPPEPLVTGYDDERELLRILDSSAR